MRQAGFRRVGYTEYYKYNHKQNIIQAATLILLLLITYALNRWGLPSAIFIAAAAVLAIAAYFLVRFLIHMNRRKQIEQRDILIRWEYENDFWRAYVKETHRAITGFPGMGIVLGIASMIVVLIFFEVSYYIAVGTGLVVMLLCWGFVLARHFSMFRNPGEVIVVPGGAYFRKTAVCWNAKSAPYDITYIEKTPDKALITIHYRKRKAVGILEPRELAIPVPPEMIADAESAVKKLNDNPYWQHEDSARLSI